MAGVPPEVDLEAEKRLIECVVALATEGVVQSAHDVSDGGLAVTLAECCFAPPVGAQYVAPLQQPLGAEVYLESSQTAEAALFGERGARAVVSVAPERLARVAEMARKCGVAARQIGKVSRDSLRIQRNGRTVIAARVSSLRETWANALEVTLRSKGRQAP